MPNELFTARSGETRDRAVAVALCEGKSGILVFLPPLSNMSDK